MKGDNIRRAKARHIERREQAKAEAIAGWWQRVIDAQFPAYRPQLMEQGAVIGVPIDELINADHYLATLERRALS